MILTTFLPDEYILRAKNFFLRWSTAKGRECSDSTIKNTKKKPMNRPFNSMQTQARGLITIYDNYASQFFVNDFIHRIKRTAADRQ